MNNLPVPLRLSLKDFNQLPGIAKLVGPLNDFAKNVLLSLTKRLTVTDNMDGDVLTVVVGGSYPLDIAWSRPSAPTMILIGQCRETKGPHTTFTSPISLDWEFTGTKVRINNVMGLSATSANTFTLTLMALVG